MIYVCIIAEVSPKEKRKGAYCPNCPKAFQESGGWAKISVTFR